MAAELSPDIEARLDDLAKRIGYFGPNARDQILKIALDGLDAKTPPPTPKMTPEEKKKALEKLEELGAAGRRWREGASGRIRRELSSVSGMAGRIVR